MTSPSRLKTISPSKTERTNYTASERKVVKDILIDVMRECKDTIKCLDADNDREIKDVNSWLTMMKITTTTFNFKRMKK